MACASIDSGCTRTSRAGCPCTFMNSFPGWIPHEKAPCKETALAALSSVKKLRDCSKLLDAVEGCFSVLLKSGEKNAGRFGRSFNACKRAA